MPLITKSSLRVDIEKNYFNTKKLYQKRPLGTRKIIAAYKSHAFWFNFSITLLRKC